MHPRLLSLLGPCLIASVAAGCHPASESAQAPAAASQPAATATSYAAAHLNDYVGVPLKADLSHFDAQDKQMIALLVQASQTMDALYWQQSWGDKTALMDRIADTDTRKLAEINFGPWDRLNADTPRKKPPRTLLRPASPWQPAPL